MQRECSSPRGAYTCGMGLPAHAPKVAWAYQPMFWLRGRFARSDFLFQATKALDRGGRDTGW